MSEKGARSLYNLFGLVLMGAFAACCVGVTAWFLASLYRDLRAG